MKLSKEYWTLDLPHFRMDGETRVRLTDEERRALYLKLHPRHKGLYRKRFITEDMGKAAADKLTAALGLKVNCHRTFSLIF